MLVTLDTSHLEMSLLNDDAAGTRSVANKLFISVTAETSQELIAPCRPLEQSVESFKHSRTAAWSSALDFGGGTAVGHRDGCHTVRATPRITIRIII